MADNENQWEEYTEDETQDYSSEYSDETDEYSDDAGEYSEDTGEYSDDSDEYSEEDYEQDGDYDDSEYEDDEYYENDEENSSNNQKSNIGIIIAVLVILLLLLVGVVFFIMKRSASDTAASGNTAPGNTGSISVSLKDVDFSNIKYEPPEGANITVTNGENNGDDFFEQNDGGNSDMISVDFNNATGETNVPAENNGGNEIVATVSDQQSNIEASNDNDLFSENGLLSGNSTQENNTIMVTYNPAARSNPFKPPVVEDKNKSDELLNNTGFEIIEPPVKSVADENLTKLLQTQISGILYDDESPSAIVNLNGVDQFVKIGDTISGYTIENITNDRVQIKYKNNSYVASVGELFTRGSLEKNRAVANLENKFAGRYKNNN